MGKLRGQIVWLLNSKAVIWSSKTVEGVIQESQESRKNLEVRMVHESPNQS